MGWGGGGMHVCDVSDGFARHAASLLTRIVACRRLSNLRALLFFPTKQKYVPFGQRIKHGPLAHFSPERRQAFCHLELGTGMPGI